MIKFKAPKVSAAEKKLLTGHKAAFEGAIAEVEGDYAKVKKPRAHRPSHARDRKKRQKENQ